MELTLNTPVRPPQRIRTRLTIYIHSGTAPVKVQVSADDGDHWVDAFVQGAAGDSAHTLAHAAALVRVVAASGSPTGVFYLISGSY